MASLLFTNNYDLCCCTFLSKIKKPFLMTDQHTAELKFSVESENQGVRINISPTFVTKLLLK